MATDAEIRAKGIKYLPLQKYLQNPYELPVEEETAPVNQGIVNTNSFNNSGNDFSVYNPDPNSIVNRNYNSRPAYETAFGTNLGDPEFNRATGALNSSGVLGDYREKPLTGTQEFLKFAGSFVPGAGIARFVGDYLPTNRRSIMENQLGKQGMMVNDIGQFVSDGGNINTAENIMAGYNASKVDADTFQKRRNMINDKMSDKVNSKTGKTFKQEKLDALDAAEKNFLDANDESEDIYNFKKKQKQVKRDKTVIGRYLNKRDRVALAKKQINPTGPSNSKRGTPGGSADRFTLDDGRTYDNSRGDFRNADGSNVSQDFNNTSASLDNYDPSVMYADGGRAGYFFGGRARLQGGGGAGMGAPEKAAERASKGYGTAPDTGSKSGTNDYSTPTQDRNHDRAMRDNQREKPSTLDNAMNLGSEVNYLKNLYKMDPIGLGIGFGVNKLRTYIKNKNFQEEDKLSYNTNPLPTNNYMAKVSKQDLSKYSQQKDLIDKQDYPSAMDTTFFGSEITPYEFQEMKKGNITEPGTYIGADGGRVYLVNGGLAGLL